MAAVAIVLLLLLQAWDSTSYDCLVIVMLVSGCCVVKVTAASRRVLLLLHFAGLLVPTLLVVNLVYATLLMFIPIMGRAGTASFPDLFIGCLTVSTVIVLSTWQVTTNCLLHVFLNKTNNETNALRQWQFNRCSHLMNASEMELATSSLLVQPYLVAMQPHCTDPWLRLPA